MAQANVWMHETVLPPVASSASDARDFVCLHLIEHQLLYLVEDFRLVASEFATIAIVRSQSSFTVMLRRVDDTVGLSVTEAPTPAAVRTRTCALDVLRAVLAEALPVGHEPWHSGTHGLSMVQVGSKAWGVETEPDGTRTMWASFAVRSRVP
jgi:hypothetical protein